MDFLDAEGVMTDDIAKKLQHITDLDLKISGVNNQIENLKEWRRDIKAKRSAVHIALDQEIAVKRRVLQKRQRRQQQLEAEVKRLVVSMFD
jgi:predicted  nucleic acid-binding Zn-ribbon protein